jgi:RND superfamily putative drug exporter
MENTIATAGRTVMFSALTIAASVAGLMAFSPTILRTFGLGGFTAVLIALLTATTLVPSCLVLLGERLVHPSPLARIPLIGRLMSHRGDAAPDTGAFSRLAAGTQKHPWLVIGGVVVVMALVASPALGLQLRNSTIEFLPKDSGPRQFVEATQARYPALREPAIQVVSQGTLAQTQAWADGELATIADVTGVTTTQREGLVVVALTTDATDPAGHEVQAVVHTIRGLEPGFAFEVTGQAARLIDFMDSLKRGAPVAAAIVALATFILLFLMTGSLLIPFKALLTNALSLLACLGVVTWLFQDGHLGSVFGFEPVSGIETYIIVLLLIFGFGLSMDYEVFLISRIKEAYDSGMDTDTAVRYGLQRSGRIITSAALIIVVVFAGFAAGKLVVIKEIGIGLAVSVALDATLVRMLLVPATMTVLGKWNWWAPRPLARLARRLALHD